jgi:3,4-dihydroxy 2-butanone 4-phosphate synthase/3,4-dihydroxy 2-butanone 4-phosphate synthase/GTP cyclohydrolase II
MKRLDSLRDFAAEHGCPLISIEDLVAYVDAVESQTAHVSVADEEKR